MRMFTVRYKQAHISLSFLVLNSARHVPQHFTRLLLGGRHGVTLRRFALAGLWDIRTSYLAREGALGFEKAEEVCSSWEL